MKTKSILILIVALFLIGGMGCEKKENTTQTKIGKIVDVFELDINTPYKENGVSISLQNVQDDVSVDCSLADFADEEQFSKIRVYAYLEIDSKKRAIIVASKPCGALPFIEGSSNIEDVTSRINSLKSAPANSSNPNYFANGFVSLFGEGVAITGTPFHIFMAKATPQKYKRDGADLNDYRFIFILVNNE